MPAANLTAQVVFATITGNNEAVADILVEELENQGVFVKKSEISQTEPEELQNFDLGFVVPYTYDEGSLPDEGLDYFDDLADVALTDFTYALAGSGDTFYGDLYCLALDAFDEQFQKTGAKRAGELTRINLYPSDQDRKKLLALVQAALAQVQK
ncbi:flavodoxin domain-containing protein [Fructobacillus americanaquae]|uniref:Flavodoxin domain-containing protein n=1 Tax=Fructobacillus americanaquae TaxID=2940302 RepID=A0ABY5C0R4_9LACO|nr:flavodoxin domain-containing protein [Fructobacillus americanaquae]USS92346.1 flavodoxin domain-containing protein [Fructobacillus americanaquae]